VIEDVLAQDVPPVAIEQSRKVSVVASYIPKTAPLVPVVGNGADSSTVRTVYVPHGLKPRGTSFS